jgi:hypothetical protein
MGFPLEFWVSGAWLCKNLCPRVGKLFPTPGDHCGKNFHGQWKEISSISENFVPEAVIVLRIGLFDRLRFFGILIAKDSMVDRTARAQ